MSLIQPIPTSEAPRVLCNYAVASCTTLELLFRRAGQAADAGRSTRLHLQCASEIISDMVQVLNARLLPACDFNESIVALPPKKKPFDNEMLWSQKALRRFERVAKMLAHPPPGSTTKIEEQLLSARFWLRRLHAQHGNHTTWTPAGAAPLDTPSSLPSGRIGEA